MPAISGAPGTSKMLVGRCHTPTARKGRPPIRTTSPIGSCAPNSRSTVRCSMTATGAPLRSSAVVNTRPATSPPPRISMYRSSAPKTPRTWVRLPAYSKRWNTCVQIAAWISGRRAIASASSGARAGRIRTSRGNASGLSGVEEKNRRMRNVVGPTTSSVLTICSRKPATIDAMAMTVAIPMTTPRMVSPERSLLTRSWSTAISQPSRMEWRAMLLGAQRVDRVEARGPVRRVDAEHDPHTDAEAQRHGHRPGRHAGGQGRRELDQRGERAAGEEARNAAEEREDGRLREKLAPDVAPGGAERLEDPDLAGALGPKRDQPLTRIDGKVVFLTRAEPMRDTHRLFGAEHAVRHARGRRHLDRDDGGLAPSVQGLEGRERQHDEPVPRLPQHGALLGDDTLDRELDATDANGAADGELGGAEQLLGHVEAEHRHEPPLSLVHVRERRPGGEVVVLHHHERRRDAEDEDVTHRAVPPLHVRHRGRPPGLQGDRLRVGQRPPYVADVLGCDDRPPLNLLPFFVVDEPNLDRVPTDLKGVDPDDRARDALAHVRVHALDHGHHRHEEPDRHDDSEQREERTELVAPCGLERLENRFGEGHGTTK